LRIREFVFLAHFSRTLPATGARATVHSKHCGVRNTFVDLLSSFQRPTDPFLLRASDCDALSAGLLDPTERARYLPPSKNPVKRRKIPPLQRPLTAGAAVSSRAIPGCQERWLRPSHPRGTSPGSGPN